MEGEIAYKEDDDERMRWMEWGDGEDAMDGVGELERKKGAEGCRGWGIKRRVSREGGN